MSESSIEWTDATWNPVTGCSRVSPGCDNCYMFAQYPRLRAMRVRGYEEAPDVVQLLPERLGQPAAWSKPRFVFVNSMSDLFHPHVPFDFITEIFKVMQQADQHVYQVLTKRPGLAAGWWEKQGRGELGEWPSHVWMGTSVESQKYAPRLDVLARIPADIRFVSAEPLIEELDLSGWLETGEFHWVIVGGESGQKARPMDVDWARLIQQHCQMNEVAFFLKQLGGRPQAGGKRSGKEAVLDGQRWAEMPATLQ